MIELLVTISIAVIMLTLAVPSFQSFIQQSRLTGYTNDLVLAMAYAKSEAVKRGINVEVCASSNSSTCTGTWQQGWIVRASNGDVLQVRTPYQGTICGSATSVTFRNTGFITAATDTTFSLYYGADTRERRTVTVNPQGRANTSTGATACS